MKKPITTYETKYPGNKQKCIYYGNCETGNTPFGPGVPGTTCYAGHNCGPVGAPW